MSKTNYQPGEGYVIPTGNYETERDGKELVIRYDIEQIESDDPKQYTANEVRVPYHSDYGAIVSAIVEDKYPDDKMQAVINNYLVSPSEGDHTTAFVEMQEWRSHAKDVAKMVLGITD